MTALDIIDTNCWNCGKWIRLPKGAELWTCPGCHKENSDAVSTRPPDILCSQCGEQMEPTDDGYLCDPCGREVRP